MESGSAHLEKFLCFMIDKLVKAEEWSKENWKECSRETVGLLLSFTLTRLI